MQQVKGEHRLTCRCDSDDGRSNPILFGGPVGVMCVGLLVNCVYYLSIALHVVAGFRASDVPAAGEARRWDVVTVAVGVAHAVRPLRACRT